MKLIRTALAICATLSLSSCAMMNQLYTANAAAVASDLRATQDNIVDTLKFSICAVPFGTVVRREDFQEIARAACLPKTQWDKDALLPKDKDGKTIEIRPIERGDIRQ